MLGRKNYTKEEIDAGRAMVKADLRAYRRLRAAAKTNRPSVHMNAHLRISVMSRFIS